MSFLSHVAYALADAFRSGSTKQPAIEKRGIDVMGASSLWLKELSICLAEETTLLNNSRRLISYIKTFPALVVAFQQGEVKLPLAKYYLPAQQMREAPEFLLGNVPELNNHAQLMDYLGLDNKQLHCLSKPWLTAYQSEPFPLQNYRYRWINKSNKGQYRLIEIPKPLLKAIQGKIAHSILNEIPIHSSAFAFRQGLSIKECVARHRNKRWILKMDLQNFFVSVSYARVYAIFNAVGYPDCVSRVLALLTTNVCPDKILRSKIREWRARQIFHIPHLPQGAPSSPSLSNLVAFKLDCRLSALAEKMSMDYSRYADDLFFSGQKKQDFKHLVPLIASIVAEEGFQVNFRKTRVLGNGQQQKLLGIVVNQGSNIPRKEYERLKAILYNCVRYGVAGQQGDHTDFCAHLKGKIAFVKMLNPHKGMKLERLFEQIVWT